MLIDDRHALSIVKRLHAAGFTAYYAGGCIRDALLGRGSDDIDIATDASPEEVTRLFPHTVTVGAHFGVVKVIDHGYEYDVAMFRTDGDYRDGRHPDQVVFATPEEDARRRDITINGMFYDPLADRIIDFVGGREDLDQRIIRAIGDPGLRISEDKLRMLRIVRFAGVLDFRIDPATMAAVQKDRAAIARVAKERIADELTKMLGSRRPAACARLLAASGLMAEILPEVMAMDGVPQPPEFHPEGDVLTHTLLMFDQFQAGIAAGELEPSADVTLGILLHDIAKPLTLTETDRIRFSGHCVKGGRLAARILKRLKYPNRLVEHVAGLVAQHMKFMEVAKMRVATLKRFLRQDGFEDHMILHRLDCTASHGDLTSYEFCRQKLAEFREEEKHLKPPPLVNGNDLIASGYTPGPSFKTMLQFAEDLQLEDDTATRDSILSAVIKAFPAASGPNGPDVTGSTGKSCG